MFTIELKDEEIAPVLDRVQRSLADLIAQTGGA